MAVPDVSVMLGNGDGTFAPEQRYAIGFGGHLLVIRDYDEDGHQDLLVQLNLGLGMSLLTGRGDGTFDPRVPIPVGVSSYFVTMSDLDGDVDLDLAPADGSEDTVAVLLNNGSHTLTPRLSSPASSLARPLPARHHRRQPHVSESRIRHR